MIEYSTLAPSSKPRWDDCPGAVRLQTQSDATREAIYAGRPFSYLPRESLHNFVTDLVELLSK